MRKLPVVFALAALGSAAAVLAMRSREANTAMLIGDAPPGIEVLPREAFGRKPIIDFTLPGIGRVIYPRPGKTPKGYVDQPEVAGLLTGSVMQVNMSNWKIDGVAYRRRRLLTLHCSQSIWGLEFIRLPYVFGEKPLVATVKTGWFAKPPAEFKVQLPGNGQEPPRISSETKSAGPWEITLAPERWIGPSFELSFGLRVEGSKAQETIVAEISHVAGQMWRVFDAVQITPGRRRSVGLSEWEHKRLKVTIHKLSREEVALVVRHRKMSGGRKRVELATLTGDRLRWMILDKAGDWLSDGWDGRAPYALRSDYGFIEGWFADADGRERSAYVDWEDLAHGTRMKATIFRRIRTETVAFDQVLPDPKKFKIVPAWE